MCKGDVPNVTDWTVRRYSLTAATREAIIRKFLDVLGLRTAVAAVLLVGVVPSGSNAMTIEECYGVVERDYANCKAGEYYNSYGQCESRRAERLASCSQGVFVPIGGSQKDQCLNRVEAEYRACGYRAVCTNRWLQGLQECH